MIGGDKLVVFEGRLKKGDESSRRLVVENKMSDGKRLRLEKGKDFAKGRDVRGRGARSKRKVMNVAKMNGDEYILITVIGGDRKAASKVRCSPFGTMDCGDTAIVGGGTGKSGRSTDGRRRNSERKGRVVLRLRIVIVDVV